MLYAIGFQGVSSPVASRTWHGDPAGAPRNWARRRPCEALTAIADELHHQYLIGFTPAAFDGKSHKIEVQLRKPELAVRARQQYVAVRKQ
jgi:hypothetical protein